MLTELKIEIEKLAAAKRLKEFHTVHERRGSLVEIRGRRVIDFTNFDYVGVRESLKVKSACHLEIEQHGLSSAAPRLGTGTLPVHVRCEHGLARFTGFESALLFSSRNQAVWSLVTGLMNEKDSVFYEDLMQSPVADAAFLVGAQALPYSLKNLSGLEAELQKAPAYNRRFIFVEGLSALTGQRAPLALLSSIAAKQRAALVVDESCALGAIGARGAGCFEASRQELGVQALCAYADLSLGLGGCGAAVLGPAAMISALVNRSRTFALETAPPSLVAAAVEASVLEVELSIAARERLNAQALRLSRGLEELGRKVLHIGEGPILCVRMEKTSRAAEMGQALFEKGFLVDVIPLRQTLSDAAVLRMVIRSCHSEKEIDTLLQAWSDVDSRVEKAG